MLRLMKTENFSEFTRYFNLNTYYKLSKKEYLSIFQQIYDDTIAGKNKWSVFGIGNREDNLMLDFNDDNRFRFWKSTSFEFRKLDNTKPPLLKSRTESIYLENGVAARVTGTDKHYLFINGVKKSLNQEEVIKEYKNSKIFKYLRLKKLERFIED